MNQSQLSRESLILLVKQIHKAQDEGRDISHYLTQLQSQVAFPRVAELFLGDYSPEYIVDFSLQCDDKYAQLSREKLIALVRKIKDCDGTEADLAISILRFNANCTHPAKSDLIFFPSAYFSESDPSPEQIVDAAMPKEPSG